MLDHDRCLEVGGSLLEALKRCDRVASVKVKGWHTVAIVIFVEVSEIPSQEKIASVLESNHHAVVPWGVAWCTHDDHCCVAKYILVAAQRLHLAAAVHPMPKRCDICASHCRRGFDAVPVPLTNQQACSRKVGQLSSMVGMEVADANELDLLGFDLQLGQLIDNADLWCRRASTHGVASIPEHVVLAVLDEVAAEGEGEFLSRVGESVGEAHTDVVHHLRAAVKAGEGDFGCGLRQGW